MNIPIGAQAKIIVKRILPIDKTIALNKEPVSSKYSYNIKLPRLFLIILYYNLIWNKVQDFF